MVMPISNAYIDLIKSFRNNCDTLIGKFKKKGSESLIMFLDVWHSMNFNFTYDKKNTKQGMLHDFKNDTLEIAKLIMLKEHFSGGTFLMYGLYSLQDYPKGSIRMELGEFSQALKMLRLKIENPNVKHEQIAFVFSVFLKEKAFDFVMFNRQYDMEGLHYSQMIYNNQYEFDLSDDEEIETLKPRDLLRKLSVHVPEEVEQLERNYFQMKNEIKSEFPFLNLSLDMVDQDISTTLLDVFTQAGNMEEAGDISDIGARRRSLKNRKIKIKQRYGNSDEKLDPQEPSSKVKKRKRVINRLYINRAINDPDYDASTDDEENIFHDDPPKQEHLLPDLY